MDILWSSIYQNLIKGSRYLYYLSGLKTTILLSLAAIACGILLGFVATFLRRSRFKLFRAIGYIYVDVIRGTPSVVQLTLIYFVVFASVNIDKFIIALIAFGLNSGAYISEIFRAGLESIDKGQTEAGRSLGLSSSQTMIYIILPQAVKNILPALVNEFIMLVKETAIVGFIAMEDLNRASEIVQSITYAPFAPRIIVAIVYYIVIKLLTLALGRFERWLKKSEH